MKKILFVIGSFRAKSFNRQMANVAKEIIGDRAEIQELDYDDLPLFSSPTCINGKRVAISGAGGKAATANCRQKLTELLTFIKAEVIPEQIGVAVPAEAWGTDVLILSDEQKTQMKAQADALLIAQ